jgi:chorismate mutase/prephenate dehydratase
MTLEELRARIDDLDAQIVELLNERARTALEIGRLKRRNGAAVFAPEREADVLKRLARANRGPLPEACIQAIYREVMSGCRSLERALRICYLGPPGTFSHLAARERFGAAAEFVPVRDIPSVFEEVARGHTDYGIVPVENSTVGSVTDTLDMFVKYELQVVAEVVLAVHHNLLAKCRRDEVRRIFSIPVVRSQCRDWLAHNFPDADVVEEASTARAAAMAAQEPGAAAIGTTLAAELYGLDVLVSHIEDAAGNSTRFFVLSRLAEVGPADRNKTSLLVAIDDRVGALFEMLKPFRDSGINLTKIESHPSRERAWNYWFFVDIEGHVSEARVAKALEAVRSCTRQVKVLGSYPAAPETLPGEGKPVL